MSALASLLLITALTFPTSFLVLRSGQRMQVDGSVTIDQGRVIFRSGGALFSIPEHDVDLDATRSLSLPTPIVRADVPNRLKVTPEERDRLLRELEQNHNGTPGEPVKLPTTNQATKELNDSSRDEWSWKRQAQAYEENIRRAREDVDLLRSKAEQLQNRVRSLLAQGFKPEQFTYDSTQLANTRDQLPYAELALKQAEREYDQFLDNARRQGVPPGWLR